MKGFVAFVAVLFFAASAVACPVAVQSSASAVVSSQAIVVQPQAVIVQPQAVVIPQVYAQAVVSAQAQAVAVVPQAVQVLAVSPACVGSCVRARAFAGGRFFRPRSRSFAFSRTVVR